MSKFCDLHTHSVCSDGTLTPAELVALAEETGLGAVALCDHNTVAGLPEFLAAAKNRSVTAVPGVEFSTGYRGGELHILALFVQPQYYNEVSRWVEPMLRAKERSNIDLIGALNGAGLSLDYAAIKAGTPNGQVNRAVIAAQMVRQGYCATVQEAFSRYLSQKHGYFQPPKRLDALETVRFIKSIGAVAVLAHPFLNLEEPGLREFLAEAVPCGLEGLEALYPKFSPAQRETAEKIAAAFGLAVSGGSAFPGANTPDIARGTGRGDLQIPLDLLEKLQKRK